MKNLSIVLIFTLFSSYTFASVKKKGIQDWTFIFNPAKVSIKTDRGIDQLNGLARELINRATDGDFLDLGINTGYVEAKIKETTASIKFFKNQFGGNDKAVKVSIRAVDNKLRFTLKMYYKHIKYLYKKERDAGFDRNRWNFSNQMEKRMEEAFKMLLKSLPAMDNKIKKSQLNKSDFKVVRN